MTVDEDILANWDLPEDQREPWIEIANRHGISRHALRRRRKALRRRLEAVPVGGTDPFFSVPVAAIQSRGRSIRLEDGSWEKITYVPGVVEAEEAKRLSMDDLSSVFDREIDHPGSEKRERLDASTRVVCLSDYQFGKVSELGGTPEAVARVARMLNDIRADIASRGGYREIILADVGDSTEGFGNVMQQQQTNDLSLTDQIRAVQRMHAEALRMLAPLCDRLVYVAVPSNHCAVRTGTGSKNRANAPDDDFGLLVQDTIKLFVSDREEYHHVSFAAPLKWEEAVTIETADGTCVWFTHGHLAGSQGKMEKWFSDLAFGHRSGLHEASVLVHGHFHNFGLTMTGDNRMIVSCPTTDNGSPWFSNVTGNRTSPAMLTFDVMNGKAKDWRLFYDN